MHHRGSAHLGSARVAIIRVSSALLAMAPLLACGDPPVEWSTSRAATAEPTVALMPDGALRPDSMALLAVRIPPPDAAVCSGSLVLSRAGGRLYAAWWRVRPDSGAVLLAARTDDDGRSWSAPAPVDTTDQGVSGCTRSPPSIAADSASGYVHVVL